MRGILLRQCPLSQYNEEMVKNLLISFLFCLFSVSVFAIIAYPYPVKVKTANGYTFITIKGNENWKYAITSDGYCVVQDSLGWKYLKRNANGTITTSDFLLEDVFLHSKELKSFLHSEKSVRQLDFTKSDNKRQPLRQEYKSQKQNNPIIGNRRALIVMMQFTDCTFTKSRNDFNALFNEQGYSVDGAYGSVYDYYKYVSYGQLDLQCDVIGPFTASHDMAYYGKNVGMGGYDRNPYTLFTEALQYASSVVSLSDYDADGDGFVDNFHIIYSGYGEEAGASHNAIWAHESTFEPITINGLQIDRYSCAPELRGNSGKGISRIGPHCHEIGHALGAMDYYDTDYSTGGEYEGTGQWDVMASGSWNNDGITPANFNPYVKAYNFGWMNIISLTADTAVIAHSSCTNNIVYRIDTPVKNDFFLIENRRQELFDINIPGEGLLIFHIGPDIENKSSTNSINATFPQNCYIVCASSNNVSPNSVSSSYGAINSDSCPFPGTSSKHSFTNVTTPAALCVNGIDANFSILEIQENEDGLVSFVFEKEDKNIEGGDDEQEIPVNGEIVWEENFKDWVIPYGWSQIHNTGNILWKKRISSNGEIFHFMELAYEASPWNTDTQTISTSLISPDFNIEQEEYVLSYDVSDISQSNNADTLKVSLENGIELCRNILRSDSWSTKNIVIHQEYIPFRIIFNGVVQKTSSLRIKNLKLRKLQSTGMSDNTVNSITLKAFYNLSGQRFCKSIKGLNILKMSDGTYRKVYQK